MIPRVFSRGWRCPVSRPQRTLSITCQGTQLESIPQGFRIYLILVGRSVGRGEVFRYTNGHFLINEEHQYANRYVRFNIDKLCELVSSVVGDRHSPVLKIDKMEGGFHKALLMTLENGCEVIAKIPCPNAGIPAYSTASEAAVLEYGESLSSI